jgi:peptidoglycan/xylan/chitin deacetylase (PgdA/CDA1 family)
VRAILTYHSIDPSRSPISLDERSFRAHVAWLAAREVQAVPLDWILKVPDARDAVALTFDDGFVNFAEAAWPLLAHNDLPVTLFVVTQRAGTDNRWDGRPRRGVPTLPLLDWDGVCRLVEKGLSLGSHSRTHPDLTRVSDTQLADEIEGSAEDLARRTGVRPTAFCYPYGRLDERIASAVGKVYQHACTTELRVLGQAPQALRLPRLDAHYYRSAARLRAWGSGGFRRRLWLRATARRLRGALER